MRGRMIPSELSSIYTPHLRPRQVFFRLNQPTTRPRLQSTTTKTQQIEGAADISHSHFISSASPSSDFNPTQQPTAGSSTSSTCSSSSKWQGKLSPTSTHLFKLILPLPTSNSIPRPTAFLLHPSQPLSHLSRLITGSLPPSKRSSEISYIALTGQESDLDSHLRNAEEDSDQSINDGAEIGGGRQDGGPFLSEREKGEGRFQQVAWSQSTDLSDFIKQSCLNEKFTIVITPESSQDSEGGEGERLELEVHIPTFASRTVYLRRRLLSLTKDLDRMTKEKKEIDYIAHKGAQRLAVVALGAGVVYWGSVIRWTFFTDAGWDVMEPVTWATGFGALLCSAAFLVYHNREVSYSSLLDLSVSSRQKSLYDKHGLDIEKWTEMVAEAKTIRKEIARIASDYDLEWKGELENLKDKERPPLLKDRKNESQTSSSEASPSSSTTRSTVGKQESNEFTVQNELTEKQKEIDIDATIDEADELASQSSEKKAKDKARQRKGESSDSDEVGGKSSGKGKGGEEERSEERGKEKAERLAKRGD